jgi:hypothetical protein
MEGPVALASPMAGPAAGPEWDHASKSCVLCVKPFGVFNRKHHCRKCGRLVCEPCSSKRLVLSLDCNNAGTPQRVCEGCYKSLTRKKIIKEEANNQKEREDALLRESSKVRYGIANLKL